MRHSIPSVIFAESVWVCSPGTKARASYTRPVTAGNSVGGKYENRSLLLSFVFARFVAARQRLCADGDDIKNHRHSERRQWRYHRRRRSEAPKQRDTSGEKRGDKRRRPLRFPKP